MFLTVGRGRTEQSIVAGRRQQGNNERLVKCRRSVNVVTAAHHHPLLDSDFPTTSLALHPLYTFASRCVTLEILYLVDSLVHVHVVLIRLHVHCRIEQ
jgi:hypothetical protein